MSDVKGDQLDRAIRLRRLMELNNLSGENVAQLLGKTAKTVFNWRWGKVRPIPVNDLRLLEILIERDGGRIE